MGNLLRKLKIKFSLVFLRTLGINIPPIPTTSCIIEKDRQILMIKLGYRDGFALPGGGVQYGETVEDAVVRECVEEIGIKPSNLKYFASSHTKKDGLNMVHISYVGSAAKIGFKSSAEGVPQWLSIEDAIANCVYEDQKSILKMYRKILVRKH